MNEQALYQQTRAGSIRGPILFQGEEELTKQDAVNRIISLLDSSFLDMNLHRLKEPSARDVLNTADQLPFFDVIHLVIVTEWKDDVFFGELNAEEKRIPGTIERFFSLADTIVLFIRRGDSKENDFTKLFSERDRQVRFDALTMDRAAKFCIREAALKTVTLSDQTARSLIEMVGTDAYRLRNELSKCCDYVGPKGTVTPDILNVVVTASLDYKAFRMLDALLSGNKKAALLMLESGITSGKESPLRIAGFLEGRLKLMLIAREMLDRRYSRKEIAVRIGGSSFAADATIKNAQKLSAQDLKQAVAAFAEINVLVKTGACDEYNALIAAIYRSF